MFSYAVKTTNSDKYFTVIARGTKRDMVKFATMFDAHPETIESHIKREKDGVLVHRFVR